MSIYDVPISLGQVFRSSLAMWFWLRIIGVPKQIACPPKSRVCVFFNYWRIKKAEHWRIDAVVLEKTLESPLDCKEIKSINCKGNQSWIFTGRTEAEAESPILWPPDVRNWLTGKDSHAGKDWGQEEKEGTQDEMVGWHHRLDGHELEQTPGDSEGQGSLVCCSPWGRRVEHNWATEE